MPGPTEGYVIAIWGGVDYLKHAYAVVVTLRRFDTARPVALYCSPEQAKAVHDSAASDAFERIEILPEDARSIVGFKHQLHRFMPYDRNVYTDSDIVWCRDPEALWQRFLPYTFTSTGLEKADLWFGGPKHIGIVADYLLKRRNKTLNHFGLTHLPRVQSGLMYASDRKVTEEVCLRASGFLARQAETHFRSRLDEAERSEETCEWSLAMAMSALDLPVVPWFDGQESPQLDFVPSLTVWDDDFRRVVCRYYTNASVYALRGLPSDWLMKLAITLVTALPERGNYISVTPYILHFGWIRHKKPFYDFAERNWRTVVRQAR